MGSMEDFEYAKSKGVMFDPVQTDHDPMIDWVFRVREQITQTRVVHAFISSLSTRRLDLRSAISSYAFLRFFPEAEVHFDEPGRTCRVCGYRLPDLNLFNFYRFQYGGLEFDSPAFAAFDLERLLEQPEHIPTVQDREILKAILDTARNLPVTAKLADLIKALAPIIKSNNNERRSLLGVLGITGVLQPKGYPSYLNEFIPLHARVGGPGRSNDWGYPIGLWKASDGVNETAVRYWFGEL
jgi:hypothetical protein